MSAVTYRFGLTLKTVTLPADWEWKNPDEKLSAGTKAYTAVYKKGVQEENVLVTVNKADNPSYVLPGDLSGTAGESLGSISLPEGWAWKDAAETLAEDKDSYQAVYTDPSGNYETIEAALDVDVSPNGSSSDSSGSSGSDGDDGNSGNGSQDESSDVSLTLNKSSVTLYTGKASESVTVKATVKGTSQAVTWTSSNPKVATVEDGLIAAVKKGTAVITASAGGISKTVRVTVKNPSIKVKKGKKSVTNVKVGEKEQIHLKVSVSPAKSGLSIEKLSKKKKKIVKVTLKGSSLIIKGKKKGKATIRIKSGKAEKAVKVTVK